MATVGGGFSSCGVSSHDGNILAAAAGGGTGGAVCVVLSSDKLDPLLQKNVPVPLRTTKYNKTVDSVTC